MPFGKKKAAEPQAPSLTDAMPVPDALPEAGDTSDGLTPELFGAESAETAPVEEPLLAGEPPPAEGAVDAPAQAAAPVLGGGDDLLRMFQESQIESSDNSAILELAGEVPIEDLLEDLLTVASAMGIKRPVPA